ncbi:DUF1669 domain-containing protein [Candidatus Woesearchaeota archaeon]|nr:DUF1669 domain-containing protein [Candidatus Woesearchaeota archaeon]
MNRKRGKNSWIFLLLFLFIIAVLFSLQIILDLEKIETVTSAFVVDFFVEKDIAISLQKVNSFIQDKGSVEVHFCPQENCELLFLNFLERAESSIHCALYDLSLSSVQEVLLRKKEEGKEVQVVTDDAYLKRFTHSFVKADGSYGLMHNKFCIVDGSKISTGSMNPTTGDTRKNNNNLLLISSQLVAQSYEDEFTEMWTGIFKQGEITKNPSVRVGEVNMGFFFCPEDDCAEKVQEEIRKAKKSVYFMTFSFTHKEIAQELLFKKLEGIEIKGIMDKTQAAGEYSVFPLLKYQGINVLKNTKSAKKDIRNSTKVNSEFTKNSLLHHKVFIIDDKTVITGSFNPTKGGDERNDENLVIIHDNEIAEQYVAEFQHLWKNANTPDLINS